MPPVVGRIFFLSERTVNVTRRLVVTHNEVDLHARSKLTIIAKGDSAADLSSLSPENLGKVAPLLKARPVRLTAVVRVELELIVIPLAGDGTRCGLALGQGEVALGTHGNVLAIATVADGGVVAVAARVCELLGPLRKVGIPLNLVTAVVGTVGVVGVKGHLLDAAEIGAVPQARVAAAAIAESKVRNSAARALFGALCRLLSLGRVVRRAGQVRAAGGRLRDSLVVDAIAGRLGAEVRCRRAFRVYIGSDSFHVNLGGVHAGVGGFGRGEHGVRHGESESSLHCDVDRTDLCWLVRLESRAFAHELTGRLVKKIAVERSSRSGW